MKFLSKGIKYSVFSFACWTQRLFMSCAEPHAVDRCRQLRRFRNYDSGF